MANEFDAHCGEKQRCARARGEADEAESNVVPALRKGIPTVNRLVGRAQDGHAHQQDHRKTRKATSHVGDSKSVSWVRAIDGSISVRTGTTCSITMSWSVSCRVIRFDESCCFSAQSSLS